MESLSHDTATEQDAKDLLIEGQAFGQVGQDEKGLAAYEEVVRLEQQQR